MEAKNSTVIKKKPASLKSGEYQKNFATTFDYSVLKRLVLQKADKTSLRSYSKYTKSKILTYIQSPQSNIDNIRAVSEWLYRVSMPYRKLIEYYSSMLLYDYNLIYNSDLTQNLDQTLLLQQYQEVSKRLNLFALKNEMPKIFATSLRDGVYFGFVYEDENSFFIHTLDPKYCKATSIEDGVYGFEFDASYFDIGDNDEFLEDYDPIFKNGYNNYKNKGTNSRWFEIPMEQSICIIIGDDPIVPLPYFLPIFVSLLDLIDYESLIKEKTELEATVLLWQKIPMLSNSQEINDFAVDLDLVSTMDSILSEASPSLTATAFTPCDLNVINFKSNDTTDTDILNQSISNLFSQVGVSEMLFNSDKGGSVGLKHSIEVDETIAFDFLGKIERWLQHYIKLNISSDFSIKFHRTTCFSKTDYLSSMQQLATLGLPVKLDLATAAGYTPYEVMQATSMENVLGLHELWKPLNSSFVQSKSNTGAPNKDPDDLSEEGQATKDGGKNSEE